MRARGAKVTDIAVIVVAADDGVMPQTVEAIDHARAADVPMLVAVNKVDKEGADPNRVRTELADHDLNPEEWGGETVYVDVSAKTKEGLDNLLEMIVLVTDLEELGGQSRRGRVGHRDRVGARPGPGPGHRRARPARHPARRRRRRRRRRSGARSGRCSTHRASASRRRPPGCRSRCSASTASARPASTCRWSRASAAPASSPRSARTGSSPSSSLAARPARSRLEEVFQRAQEGELKELNIVLKADVAGSLEALEDEIAKVPQEQVPVNVIHAQTGGINESDVMLASASDAIIIGFNVRPLADARRAAEREGVDVRTYTVIYKVTEELRAAMEGMLEPEEVEETLGQAEVLQTFKASRVGTIAGCQVNEGKVTRNAHIRLVRDGTIVIY